MLTFTTLTNRVTDITGVSTSSTDIPNFQMDINQGLRLFKNAARRYWTRKEVTANLVENQQYYTLPADMVRVTEVRVYSNGLQYPVEQVSSEYIWNKLNIIPAVTINIPTYFFIRGRNEIGLWPIPSSNADTGLVVSYEPRLADMSLSDVTNLTVSVTNGSTTVTNAANGFLPNMVGQWFSVTDGTDGNWYQIVTYDNAGSIELENYYQGATNSSGTATCTIGQAPDIPEDYQLGLVYFAAYNFYLKRNEENSAMLYKGMFDDLLQSYRETYAAKTTGVVQSTMDKYRYNIFTIPPNTIT